MKSLLLLICAAAVSSAAAPDGTMINAHSEARFGKPIAFRKIPGTAGTMALEAASGRLYAPIEEKIQKVFGPFVGNTHTETNITGTLMTQAYHQAHEIIKRHVNAGPNDAIL